MSSLLTIENATVRFHVPGGDIRAIDGVTCEVNSGETVAVVGESGCGKTTLARAVLGLQPLSQGTIRLLGREVKGVIKEQAKDLGMVWQDPYASLNPRWKIGRSVTEAANLCGSEPDPRKLLEEVGLNPDLVERFPHELSGGQRQRIAIARAIAMRPPLLICDEPTAALDLSARAQILNLLKDVQKQFNCSFLYISHDLTTVRFLADRVVVMYLGKVVEQGPTEEIFSRPHHPYTASLIDSAPSIKKLQQLPEPPPGEIPDPRTYFTGCRFAARCKFATAECEASQPPEQGDKHKFACIHPLNMLVNQGQ